MDRITPEARSANMRAVRGRDTAPEMRVRSLAHRMGYRFRLHRRDLPGSPDLVFPRRRIVIFVHGCFWHRHPGCRRTTVPKSRTGFWKAKFDRNVARDAANEQALRDAGWKVVVIWECETKDAGRLETILLAALGAAREDDGVTQDHCS